MPHVPPLRQGLKKHVVVETRNMQLYIMFSPLHNYRVPGQCILVWVQNNSAWHGQKPSLLHKKLRLKKAKETWIE